MPPRNACENGDDSDWEADGSQRQDRYARAS